MDNKFQNYVFFSAWGFYQSQSAYDLPKQFIGLWIGYDHARLDWKSPKISNWLQAGWRLVRKTWADLAGANRLGKKSP